MPTITLSNIKVPITIYTRSVTRSGNSGSYTYTRNTSSFTSLIDGAAFNSSLRWGDWYFNNNYTVVDEVEYEITTDTPELRNAIANAQAQHGALTNLRLVAHIQSLSIVKEAQDPTATVDATVDELTGWRGHDTEPIVGGRQATNIDHVWSLNKDNPEMVNYIVGRVGPSYGTTGIGPSRKADVVHLTFSIIADYTEIPENKIISVTLSNTAGKPYDVFVVAITYSHNKTAYTLEVSTSSGRGSWSMYIPDAAAASSPPTSTQNISFPIPASIFDTSAVEQYTVRITPSASPQSTATFTLPIKTVPWSYSITPQPMPTATGSTAAVALIFPDTPTYTVLMVEPGMLYNQGTAKAMASMTAVDTVDRNKYLYKLVGDAGGGSGVIPLYTLNFNSNGLLMYPAGGYRTSIPILFESGPPPVIPKIISAVVSSSTTTTYSEAGSGTITSGATWESTIVSNVAINGTDKYRIEISDVTISSSTGVVSTLNGYYLYTDGDTSNLGLYKGVTTAYPGVDRMTATFSHLLGGANNGNTAVTIKLVSGTGSDKVVYDTATIIRSWPVNNSPVISANVPSVWLDSTKLFDITKTKTALPRLRPGWPKNGTIQFEMKNVPNTAFKVGFNQASVSGVYINTSGVDVPIDNTTVIPKASIVKLTHIGSQSEGSAIITLTDTAASPSVAQRIEFLLMDSGIITDTEFNKTALASSN